LRSELLGRAVAELRGDLDLDDLALAVGQAAHLLGVLRLAGDGTAHLQAAGIGAEKPIPAG
jgi:hypothetical protein